MEPIVSTQAVVALTERLLQYEARDRASQLDGAVGAAIAAAGIPIRPGTEGQLTALLRGDVVEASANGQTVMAGPGLKPLADHVRARLESPEFAHFRSDRTPLPPDPAAGRPAPPARPMSTNDHIAAAIAGFSGAAPDLVAAGETLGARAVLAGVASRQDAPPAAVDMSQRFGLRLPTNR